IYLQLIYKIKIIHVQFDRVLFERYMPLLSCQAFLFAVSFCGMMLFIGKTTSPNFMFGLFLWLREGK
ncbi:hypothetical protein, partial [Klebsiella pneumoniae]|uniref:hypothetical protein n=1 Tax=Klebsiella pneumoniae TaxID=573 RepID=UPI001C7F3B4E